MSRCGKSPWNLLDTNEKYSFKRSVIPKHNLDRERLVFILGQTTPQIHESNFPVCCSRFSVPGSQIEP